MKKLLFGLSISVFLTCLFIFVGCIFLFALTCISHILLPSSTTVTVFPPIIPPMFTPWIYIVTVLSFVISVATTIPLTEEELEIFEKNRKIFEETFQERRKLINCKVCQQAVSTNAISCPHCGDPIIE